MPVGRETDRAAFLDIPVAIARMLRDLITVAQLRELLEECRRDAYAYGVEVAMAAVAVALRLDAQQRHRLADVVSEVFRVGGEIEGADRVVQVRYLGEPVDEFVTDWVSVQALGKG